MRGVGEVRSTWRRTRLFQVSFFFFFQAEDGIRDYKVTGVQTCALPICPAAPSPPFPTDPACAAARRVRHRYAIDRGGHRLVLRIAHRASTGRAPPRAPAPVRTAAARWRGRAPTESQIGRASCRERV